MLIPVVQCAHPDPCLRQNHVEIDEYRRSSGYTIAYPEEPLCDDELPNGWYRFTSAAGGTMPTTRVERKRCGTIVPIWMSGDPPRIGDGKVTRKACANFETGGPQHSNGCEQTVDIGVKNCTNFLATERHAQPDNDSYPKLTQSPRLSQPEIVGKTFRFVCQFEYAHQHPQQAFEVAWTFEGVTKHTDQVADPSRSASLDGTKLKGDLGKSLGCKVRAFYTNHPQHTKGPWLESNLYWAGIRPEAYHVTISEKDELRNVTLTSTIPILCQDTKAEEDNFCCIPLDLRVDGAAPDKLEAGIACTWPLCKSLWNDATKEARIPIPLSASKDKIEDDKGTDLLLRFQNIAPDQKHGPYLGVFDNYEIRSVQIDVFDAETKTCSLNSDPHFIGLSGNHFNLYRVGDYTMYQNTERHFEVQIRTWPCWGGKVTCACAVAVRELDDVIVINACDETYYANGMASPEIKTFRKLRQGVAIKQATDGSQIGVYLPSGSEVLVKGRNGGGAQHWYLDVELKVPAMDRGHGRGICGTFDDDNANEFTHRDGHVDTMCNKCEPRLFTESWSNNMTSLFKTRPPPLNAFYFKRFCQCDEANSRACNNCEDQAGKVGFGQFNDTPGETDKDDQLAFLTGVFHDTNATTQRRRQIATSTYVDVDESSDAYDPDDYRDFEPKVVTWAMPRNITEAEAKRTCRQKLESAAIWPHCRGKLAQKAETRIANCVEDVKIGDTFDAMDSMIESFTTACQVELAKDPSNYQTNPATGKSVMKPEISTDICSTNCELHGHCDRGRCVCDQGFTGDNCQLPVNQPPVLYRVRGFVHSDDFVLTA
ncbi:hypothetical protein BaRGS_00024513 [Batillaria attramentaria]|uniref:VWFD domain-containing protein n=1 Tax=Batillaria attramentaria TaxID=370345 RepID=A0ABD0KB06_9CAEN